MTGDLKRARPAPALAPSLNVDLYQAIRQLLLTARTQVRQTVNTTMVQTYWVIGQKIVENEQGGHKRAAYGRQVLPELARRLGEEFGAGFDTSNLRNMRQFYLCFPIRDAVRRELSWTHYRALMPTEAELQAELERDRALIEMN